MGFEMVFWHWWAFAAFLLIVELLAPGLFFLWMSQAAAVTGVLLWLWPSMPWELQASAFSLLSVLGVVIARRFFQRHAIASDQPLLNHRTAQLIGQVFSLQQPIVNGHGKIKVGDSLWKVCGPDCGLERQVRVIDADGVVLRIELVDKAIEDG